METIAFYPIIKIKRINIEKNQVIYKDIFSQKIYEADIVHFSNSNTRKARYKFEKEIIDQLLQNKKPDVLLYKCKLKYLYYLYLDNFSTLSLCKDTCYRLSPKWIQNLYNKIRVNK